MEAETESSSSVARSLVFEPRELRRRGRSIQSGQGLTGARPTGVGEEAQEGRSIDLQLLVAGVEEEGRGEEDGDDALLGRPEVGTTAVHCRGWLVRRRRRAAEEARGRDSHGVGAGSAGPGVRVAVVAAGRMRMDKGVEASGLR
jgi:hypothetical protein